MANNEQHQAVIPPNDDITESAIAEQKKDYMSAVDNEFTIILRQGEGTAQPPDANAEESLIFDTADREGRDLTREEQERIVELSKGKLAFEGGSKGPEFDPNADLAGGEKRVTDPSLKGRFFGMEDQEPIEFTKVPKAEGIPEELKDKVFKPGEHPAQETGPVEFKQPTREERFGVIRQGELPPEVPTFIPGSYFGGPSTDEGEKLAEFINQITVGASSDVIVNVLTQAEGTGQNVRDLTIPGANTPSGEPATVNDILKVFGLDKKVKIKVEKLEAAGDPGTALARGLTGFLLGMGLLKSSTGAGPLFTGAGADFLAVDRDANISSMLNQFLDLDPGLSKSVLDFLDNTKTESETRKGINNVLEGFGLGGLTAAIMKALKEARKAELTHIENEVGAIRFPGFRKKKTVVKVPRDIDREDFEKWVNTEGRSIDIGERYSINWETQTSSEEIKRLRSLHRLETREEIEASIPERMKMDNEAIKAEATARLKENPQLEYEKFLARNVETDVFDPVDVLIARKLAQEASTHHYDLMQAVYDRIPGADELYLDHFYVVQPMVEKQFQQHSAAAGRLLQAFNADFPDIPLAMNDYRKRLAIAKQEMKPGMNALQLAIKMKNSIETPEEATRIARQLARPGAMDMFLEVWVNGLLSGISTQWVNNLNGLFTSLWVIPERAVGAQFTKIARTLGRDVEAGGVTVGEARAMWYGWRQGLVASQTILWRNLKNTFNLNEIEFSEWQKVEQNMRKSITPENLGIDDAHPMAKVIRGFAEFIRIPSKLLMTGDDFWKSIGYYMELNRRGFLKALDEGFDGKPKEFEIGGKNMDEFIQDYIKNPPLDIHADAEQFGRYITFTKDLDDIGQHFQKWRNSHPSFTLVVPFMRTLANIFKFTGERLPVAVLAPKVQTELMAGGARRDMALAKMAMGTGVLMLGSYMQAEGWITGSGQFDKKVKKLRDELKPGWQANSVVHFKDGKPDKYYAIDRFDPIGGIFLIGAQAQELMTHLSEDDSVELVTGLTMLLYDTMLSKTFMRGIAEFMNNIVTNKDPLAWSKGLAGSLMPSIAAQFEKTISPQKSETGVIDPEVGEDAGKLQKTYQKMQEMINRFRERTPFISDDPEKTIPIRNHWAEIQYYEPAWPIPFVSPIYTVTAKPDVVSDEMMRLEMSTVEIGEKIFGIPLSMKQLDRLRVLYGDKTDGVRDRKGRTQWEFLREYIASDTYQNDLTDSTDEFQGTREKILLSIQEFYKKMAIEKLAGVIMTSDGPAPSKRKPEFPELQKALLERMDEKIEVLTGEKPRKSLFGGGVPLP